MSLRQGSQILIVSVNMKQHFLILNVCVWLNIDAVAIYDASLKN